jgi:hypothetical protein
MLTPGDSNIQSDELLNTGHAAANVSTNKPRNRVVRYRSRVDLDRGCKEGAKAVAHIGGLRGAGTWLSPAEIRGDADIPHAVPKPL